MPATNFSTVVVGIMNQTKIAPHEGQHFVLFFP